MSSLPLPCSDRRAGFTLIEMIVSITILILIIAGGIASYITFNDRQVLLSSGQELQLMMRTAQKKARVGEKPTGCDRLLGYDAVSQNADLGQVELIAVCENGQYVRESVTLPTNVTVETAFQLRFQVLHGGVQNSGTVSLVTSSRRYSFDVNQGGGVGEGTLGPKD